MSDSKNLDDLLYSFSAQRILDEFRDAARNTVYSDEWRAKEQERILNQKRRCHKCRKVLKYRELQILNVPWHTNLYCTECLPKVKKRYTFTCHSCEVEFLYRQQRTLCDQCRIYDRSAQSDLIQRHKQKSKQKGLPADLDLCDWLDNTLKHFDGKCAYCQKQPFQELDHFNPHGGTTRKNCVPACYACNHDKIDFDTADPPVHLGTNYIDWFRTPKNMSVPLFEGIKRVAAYLMVPFPYEVSEGLLYVPEKSAPMQQEE